MNMENQNKQESTKKGFLEKYGIYIIIVFGLFILFNQWQIYSLNNQPTSNQALTQNTVTGSAVIDYSKYLPKGIPPIYGTELGVSFDDPVKAIDILNQYDDLKSGARGSKAITLSQNLQSRYIKITTSIGCEFCCGAQAITTSTGDPACSCAHSGAMRGLAKYLLKNHASEYTDKQILEQLTNWKILFFPKQMIERITGTTANVPGIVGGC